MRALAAAIVLAATLVTGTAAWSVEPDEILKDARLEARARAISADLRCLVCQNESIDESQAPLARDLRQIVRERLQAGDSDRAIVDGLRARYGDFILLKPPVRVGTLLLWGTPAIVILAGALGIAMASRRRGPVDQTAPLSEAEARRVRDIVEG